MNVILTSPWIPPEWVKAHGHEPRGLWSMVPSSGNNAALQEGMCSFARAAMTVAVNVPDSAMVFTTHCDQMRRGCDAASGGGTGNRTFLFNLPATWQTRAALDLYAAELERLGRFLVELGGRAPTELAAWRDRYGLARRRLTEAAATHHGRCYAQAVTGFHSNGTVQLPSSNTMPRPAARHPPCPIALVGGPFPASFWELFDLVESAGGTVVLNATENGERSLGSFDSPESAKAGLAEEFFCRCIDVFQRPNSRLYQWLAQRLKQRNVRGILLWHYVGCDLWRAEADSLREKLGLPVLLLEAEESAGVSPRLAGRVEAFIETLRPEMPL